MRYLLIALLLLPSASFAQSEVSAGGSFLSAPSFGFGRSMITGGFTRAQIGLGNTDVGTEWELRTHPKLHVPGPGLAWRGAALVQHHIGRHIVGASISRIGVETSLWKKNTAYVGGIYGYTMPSSTVWLFPSAEIWSDALRPNRSYSLRFRWDKDIGRVRLGPTYGWGMFQQGGEWLHGLAFGARVSIIIR